MRTGPGTSSPRSRTAASPRRVRLSSGATPLDSPRYAFGEFVLDTGTRQLLRAGREVPLAPKTFDLLELLVRARPRAVSRTRLVAAIWPDTHVGASSLHVLVSQVRSVLGDDAAEPLFVRTVDRFGYAFAAAATEEGSEATPAPSSSAPGRPRARIVAKEHEFVLGEGAHVLGRDEAAAVRAEGVGVSRQHARLAIEEGQATLEDLGSKNGTFVAGERLSSPRVLRDGDEIRLGQAVRLHYYAIEDDETKTEGPA
jgi:DNA-binding winged helix-turn-helix (wHTH) protein